MKHPISEYDYDNPKPVLLWNDECANPVVGKWCLEASYQGVFTDCFQTIDDDGDVFDLPKQPTHFTPVEEIK